MLMPELNETENDFLRIIYDAFENRMSGSPIDSSIIPLDVSYPIPDIHREDFNSLRNKNIMKCSNGPCSALKLTDYGLNVIFSLFQDQ